MTTILPIKNKKEIKKTYIQLFFIRTLVSFIVGLIILIVFQLTLYFVIFSEVKTLTQEYNENKKEEVGKLILEYRNVSNDLKDINKKFVVGEISRLDVVKYLFSLKSNNIIFNMIQINKEGEKFRVNISGYAVDRDSLVEFTNNLEDNPKIENVNFPVSSLTNSYQIPINFSFLINFNE